MKKLASSMLGLSPVPNLMLRLGLADVPYYKNAQRPDLLEAGACDVPYYKSAQRPDLLEAGVC